MALIKCKECKSDVSSKADACPKCGIKVNKAMGCGSIFALIGLSFILVVVISSVLLSSLDTGSGSSGGKSPSQLKNEIKAQIKLEWTWNKAGFDNIMKADFKITNASTHDIKDVQIRTFQFAKSGTQLDRNVRTIYEIIKAGETKEFIDFNMGFIHSQSDSASASVSDFSFVK